MHLILTALINCLDVTACLSGLVVPVFVSMFPLVESELQVLNLIKEASAALLNLSP